MRCISRFQTKDERPLGLNWRSSKIFIGTTAFVASFTVSSPPYPRSNADYINLGGFSQLSGMIMSNCPPWLLILEDCASLAVLPGGQIWRFRG